jgi:lipid-A-disaccharide synthase
LVAGEVSGDLLGAALIQALKQHFPGATFYGVTGPRMRAAGCESIASIDELSVMGIVEVLKHLPRLLRLRSSLFARFTADRPDCVIGIDAPDFNLPLERKLRNRGLRTVHVVSPTIWAWRPGRVHRIAQSIDLMLCLFPFEPKYYTEAGVRAEYIGHPLAEELSNPLTREVARLRLRLPPDAPCVAILPGSRGSELRYLADSFVETGGRLAREIEGVTLVVPIAKPSLRPLFEEAIARHAPNARWWLVDGRSREAMCAADAVLLASGTASLECLLLDRPMVISYRASRFTAWLLRKLVKVQHVGLPNLLCAEPVVPEILQEDAVPERLVPPMLDLLRDASVRRRQLDQFAAVREELKRNAAVRGAAAIAQLLAG